LAAPAPTSATGQLRFFNTHAGLADKSTFKRFIAPLRHTKWVVYCKAPFAGPEQVLRYLSRYTHIGLTRCGRRRSGFFASQVLIRSPRRRCSSVSGTSKPSAFAVLRLIPPHAPSRAREGHGHRPSERLDCTSASANRFSQLARIDKGNVKNLKLAYAVPLVGGGDNEYNQATQAAFEDCRFDLLIG
jgi:hypothetical protein